jgi:hypothetical protein
MINDKQWLCEVDAWDPTLPTAENTTMTFTRASVAYDPTTGAQTASGQPRVAPLGPQGSSVLMEMNTSNLVTNSKCDNLTGWQGTNSSTITLQATSPGGAFPPGMTSCIKNTLTTVNGITSPSGFNLALNTPHTASIWCYVPSSVAAGTAWIYVAYVNVGFVAFNNVLVTERDVWVEKVVNFTSNATYASHIIGLGILGGTIGNVHYSTKVQIEALTFRTTFTVGNRSSDALSFATAGKLSMTAGTIEFWMSPICVSNWHNFFNMSIGTTLLVE